MGFLRDRSSTPLLIPQDDGRLRADSLLTMAVMGPRLQATLKDDGTLSLALWGGGDLGRMRLDISWQGPFYYGPNMIEAGHGGLFLAQSQPALLIRNAHAGRLSMARKPARWAKTSVNGVATTKQHERWYTLPWGVLCLQQRGDDLLIAAGSDAVECQDALALGGDKIEQEARGHATRCDMMPEAAPLLRSMVINGIHTALASRRYLSGGRYAGLAAGMNYSFPSRTYYRDGHWTLQALLHADPAVVPAQIALLAEGIHADGEAPSACIVADPPQLKAWTEFRLSHPAETAAHQGPHDWWSDHTDSPLYFIISIGDYVDATGDKPLFAQYLPQIKAIFQRYADLAAKGGGLPQKPRHDRDWADNVFRAGDVSYIAGLWLSALNILIRMADGALAQQAADEKVRLLAALPRLQGASGWPVNYRDAASGITEDNLSLDILTLAMGDAPASTAILDSMRMTLETRHNKGQPWGDWGVMCAWPPYTHRQDLRGKTIFPYRYHNGSDWPWLDGLYARELLRRGQDGWEYALLRWWEYGLAQGWTSPVEYYSPRWGRGSLLQGWSSMAAAAALSYPAIILQKMKR